MKSAGVGAARLWRLELNSYLDALQTLLKVLEHFMSTNCSLINSTSKLCRVDECPAKGTFPTLSLEPVDGLIDLLATFKEHVISSGKLSKNMVLVQTDKQNFLSWQRSA